MSYPRITIVTPVYNRVKYIEDTILSIISQNYPDLEYIIIDGGSTDGTLDILKKYSNKLEYWISEPDEGMYDALNKGFSRSTGEIMGWLNSDDKYIPGSLFVVADIFMSNKDIKWMTGTPSIIDEYGNFIKIFPIQFWSKKRILSGDYKWIQQESTFWAKSLWNEAGGNLNTGYKLASDFDLWTRFLELTKLYSINTVLAGFRIHANQLTNHGKSDYENEALLIYKNYYRRNHKHWTTFLVTIFDLISKMNKSSFSTAHYLSAFMYRAHEKLYGRKYMVFYDINTSAWQINKR